MRNNKLTILIIIFVAVLFSSCQTYHLSTQSLLEQCAKSKKEEKVLLFLAPPFFFPGVVNGNDLREIKCLDKNEKEKVIAVTYRTGVRITKKNNKRKTFYFNTLIIRDSVITGSNTHFFNAPIKPIKLDDIIKIELQE